MAHLVVDVDLIVGHLDVFLDDADLFLFFGAMETEITLFALLLVGLDHSSRFQLFCFGLCTSCELVKFIICL